MGDARLMLVAAIALGLVVGGVIGGLGGGGGALTVPVLVYLLGQPAQDATTGSIVIVGITAAVGVLARLRGGGVDWRTGIALGLAGIPAAALGTLLNHAVAERVLLVAFAVLTVLVAAAMLLDGRGGDGEPEPVRRAGRLATALRLAASGAGVGFLTGFLGVGGGFLAVPLLVLVLRMPMALAVGTSLLVIVVNAGSALVSRVGVLPTLDWPVLGAFTGAAVVGALVATRVADRLSGPALTRAFAVLLLAVGLSIGAANLLA